MKNSQRYFESRAINEQDMADRQKVLYSGNWQRGVAQDALRSASLKRLASSRAVWEVGNGA